MTSKTIPTEGINLEEELAQLHEAIENLDLFDPDHQPDDAITYLGDIVDAASRARQVLEARRDR